MWSPDTFSKPEKWKLKRWSNKRSRNNFPQASGIVVKWSTCHHQILTRKSKGPLWLLKTTHNNSIYLKVLKKFGPQDELSCMFREDPKCWHGGIVFAPFKHGKAPKRTNITHSLKVNRESLTVLSCFSLSSGVSSPRTPYLSTLRWTQNIFNAGSSAPVPPPLSSSLSPKQQNCQWA